MATYPYFSFWEGKEKGQDVKNSPQKFKTDHTIISGAEKTLSLLRDEFSERVIQSQTEKPEELTKTLISQTLRSQNILHGKFRSLPLFPADRGRQSCSMWSQALAGRGAAAAAPALPSPAGCAWPAPTNCHMFQLVWLWTMIYFHYFWQSLSHSFGQ